MGARIGSYGGGLAWAGRPLRKGVPTSQGGAKGVAERDRAMTSGRTLAPPGEQRATPRSRNGSVWTQCNTDTTSNANPENMHAITIADPKT